jgi:hypothetical protein
MKALFLPALFGHHKMALKTGICRHASVNGNVSAVLGTSTMQFAFLLPEKSHRCAAS